MPPLYFLGLVDPIYYSHLCIYLWFAFTKLWRILFFSFQTNQMRLKIWGVNIWKLSKGFCGVQRPRILRPLHGLEAQTKAWPRSDHSEVHFYSYKANIYKCWQVRAGHMLQQAIQKTCLLVSGLVSWNQPRVWVGLEPTPQKEPWVYI